MFKRILVPVDGTEHDVDAIHIARHLAEVSEGATEQPAARIVLVRVEPEHVRDDKVFADKAQLEEQAHELRVEGFDAYALIEFDRPESGIATVARYQHSDVIVMAPRHHSGLDAILHPGVTARLFARSPAPLLVWPSSTPESVSDPSQAHPHTHTLLQYSASLVIVPLDGSELAEQALPYATAIAADYDRTVALLRIAPRMSLIGAGAETLLLEAEAQQEENRKALRYLKGVRRQLSHETSLVVQTVLRVGDPARELARFAEAHPDSLLVMSTHGRGGLGRLLVGSVTTSLVRTVSVPILVIPATDTPHALKGGGFSVHPRR